MCFVIIRNGEYAQLKEKTKTNNLLLQPLSFVQDFAKTNKTERDLLLWTILGAYIIKNSKRFILLSLVLSCVNLFAEICSSFISLYKNKKNIKEVTVTTAYTGPGVIHRDYHDHNGYLYIVCDEGSALSVLDAQGNGSLISVDLSQNSLLSDVRFNSCNLGSLDLSNNSQLTVLTCGGNNLSYLDVSNNPFISI